MVDTAYISTSDAVDWIRDPNPGGIDLEILASVCEATSRAVDAYCNVEHFYLDETESVREYLAPRSSHRLEVADFVLSDGFIVKIDEDFDGVYETTLTSGTDFRVAPFNGVTSFGVPRSYTTIVLAKSRSWPKSPDGFPTVEVTSKLGWPTIPEAIPMATRIIASKLDFLKFARAGVAAVGDFGPIRVQGNRDAESLLAPYQNVRGLLR